MKVSELFDNEPLQWGLRGDPYLWRELQERLKGVEMPKTRRELLELIQEEYLSATGKPITHPESFSVERFRHGGMSSGEICPDFWNNKAIPLILDRRR